MKNRLEEIRKAKGITQSLENGRYNPSIILAFKIARFFEVSIEEVFIFEEDEK